VRATKRPCGIESREPSRPGRLERYGIGRVARSVREKADSIASSDVVTGELPHDRPRYLMGWGLNEDRVEPRDCAAYDPSIASRQPRMGRNGADVHARRHGSTSKAREFRKRQRPVDEDCDCSAAGRSTRGLPPASVSLREDLGIRRVQTSTFPRRLCADARRRDPSRRTPSPVEPRDWLARYNSRTVHTA